MKPERLEKFKKLTDDKKYELSYKDFTISEIKELIAETPMCDLDKRISVAKFINLKTNDEIAEIEHLDTRSVSRHVLKIKCMMKYTCIKHLI